MNYLLLVHSEENDLGPKTEKEFADLIREHLAYDEALRESGHFIVAEALQPDGNTTTVKLRQGKLSVTDGPFAETKEITGFILINAKDFDTAIRIASKVPSARMGAVELRPVRDLFEELDSPPS